MSESRKQLSIALTGKRKMQIAYLYAVLSILRGKEMKKVVKIFDVSMDIANKALKETYRELLVAKKDEIVKLISERFNIPANEAEKFVVDQLDLDITIQKLVEKHTEG